MSTITREDILSTLREIRAQGSDADVVSAGMISGVTIRGGEIGFLITIDPKDKDKAEPLRAACEKAVAALTDVKKVTAVLTAEASSPAQPEPHSHAPRQQAVWNKTPVEHVKHVVVVASGKGGVGKSTASVCLAHALAQAGKHVGLLDADIYGPSIPRMMGISDQPEVQDNKLVPLENHGVKCMSVGFLMGDEAAVLRGPMITKALHQMIRQVQWGTADEPLDILLIDLPPGTGDVQLSLAQQVAIAGAVVITTPQQVAVADARKAVQMFRKVDIRILGVLENMSYLTHPDSGSRIYPFGQGGGEALAKEMSTLFLGQMPLLPELGMAMDMGEKPDLPLVVASAVESLLRQLKILDKAA